MDANLVAFIAIGVAAGASGLAAVLAAKLYAAGSQIAALTKSNELLGAALNKAAKRITALRAITPKRGSNGKFLPRANGAAKPAGV